MTAWNSGGEGIHSPSLFNLVRMIVYDDNAYYAFAPIERERQRLLSCEDTIRQRDYGTGAAKATDAVTCAGTPPAVERRVCDIARTHLEKPRVAQMLFRIANYLTGEQRAPLTIVELGTSLGITTAYLASPSENNRVVTFEGAEEVAQIAAGVWKDLVLTNISQVTGNIDDMLPHHCPGQVDMAYIDANHTREATLRYFRQLLPAAKPHSIYVIDDIHHSPGMYEAWREIQNMREVISTLDLYHTGIVLFNPHLMKKHYKLRI